MDSAWFIFLDLGIILVLAAFVGTLFHYLRQPLIPAYILLGAFLLPVLHWIHPGAIGSGQILAFMKPIEHIGVALLLFIVGLEFDFKKLRDIGPVASLGTLAQFVLLFFIGFGIAQLFNLGSTAGIYFGLIAAFSSTMVVVKMLTDKGELETLHGRIIIGILLMQDFLAVIALIFLKSSGNPESSALLLSLFTGFLIVLGAWLLTKFIFPRLFKVAAHNQEFLLILSLAVCFAFSILFEWAGFSIAIGAFIGGVTLGNLPYSHEISGKMKSLKDFFLLLFFVSIGAQFVFDDLSNLLVPLLLLLGVIIIIKPLAILFMTSVFGYKKRTATLASLSLGQVSEFSLIIVALGVTANHISSSIYSMTIMLALVTIASTSYVVKFDDFIYNRIAPLTRVFERFSMKKKELKLVKEEPSHDVVVIGADRMGHGIIKALRKQGKDFLVVDFNPDIVKRLIRMGIHCMYGDIGDQEIRNHLHLKQVKLVISTIPDVHENLLLLNSVKEKNAEAVVILTANYADDALTMYNAGADYVIIPHYLGGEHLSVLLEKQALDLDALVTTKIAHINDLRNRGNSGKHR